MVFHASFTWTVRFDTPFTGPYSIAADTIEQAIDLARQVHGQSADPRGDIVEVSRSGKFLFARPHSGKVGWFLE